MSPSILSPAAILRSANDWRIGATGYRYPPDTGGLAPAVVVTGGSAGIGLEIARLFHAQGDTVVLLARRADALAEAAASISAAGTPPVHTLALDITAADAPASIEADLAARGLYLDVLVNNAGIGLAGPFDSHAPAELDTLVALDVAAPTRLMRHFLPGMRSRRRGGVLNVSSLGGQAPGPNQAAYYASKAYLTSLSEAVAAELAGSGVRMTVVSPGPVSTGFHAAMDAERSLYRWVIPPLSPQRVARSAVHAFRVGIAAVVPGVFNRLLMVSLWLLPHAVSVPFVQLLLEPWRPAPPAPPKHGKNRAADI